MAGRSSGRSGGMERGKTRTPQMSLSSARSDVDWRFIFKRLSSAFAAPQRETGDGGKRAANAKIKGKNEMERKTLKVETYFRCLMEDKLHNISPSKTYSERKNVENRYMRKRRRSGARRRPKWQLEWKGWNGENEREREKNETLIKWTGDSFPSSRCLFFLSLSPLPCPFLRFISEEKLLRGILLLSASPFGRPASHSDSAFFET